MYLTPHLRGQRGHKRSRIERVTRHRKEEVLDYLRLERQDVITGLIESDKEAGLNRALSSSKPVSV